MSNGSRQRNSGTILWVSGLLAGTLVDCASVVTPSQSDGDPALDAALAGPLRLGWIDIDRNAIRSPAVAGAAASFALRAGTDPIPGCTTRQVAACRVTDCRTDEVGTDAYGWRPSDTFVGAGRIAVSQGPRMVTLSRDASGRYPNQDVPLPWMADETVHVATTGDVVPAFATDLLFPPHVQIQLPVVNSHSIDVDRSVPLALQWVPIAHEVDVFIGSGEAVSGQPHHSVAIECTLDGHSGRGEIPAPALSTLVARGAGMAVWTFDRQSVVAGAFAIDVRTGDVAMTVQLAYH